MSDDSFKDRILSFAKADELLDFIKTYEKEK